jgi:anti-sigma-K factor RskA
MSDRERTDRPGEPGGHARWEDDAAAYALGALDHEEAEAFRRHLETCASCRRELTALEPFVGALPLAAEQYEAPAGLRRRVLERARAEARDVADASTAAGAAPDRLGWSRRPALIGGLLAGVVALAIVVGVLVSGGSGGTRVYVSSVGHAKLYVTSGHTELVVRRLAVPSSGHTYEAWLLHPHAAPTPAGLFGVSPTGSGRVRLHGGLKGVSAVAVTEEPASGTLRPTTTPVIVAPIT